MISYIYDIIHCSAHLIKAQHPLGITLFNLGKPLSSRDPECMACPSGLDLSEERNNIRKY